MGRGQRRTTKRGRSGGGDSSGRKAALRLSRPSGTVIEEVVHPVAATPPITGPARVLTVPLVRAGELVAQTGLDAARERMADGLRSLPWEGLALSNGEPAIPTRVVPP